MEDLKIGIVAGLVATGITATAGVAITAVANLYIRHKAIKAATAELNKKD